MHIRSLEWVDRFNRYLTTERRVSPHTTSNYLRDIALLVAFCDREGIEHWHGVLVPEVRRFAARSHAGGLSPQSVQRLLSAVRTFMRFLVREGVIGGNYAEFVQAPKAGRRLPSVLDVDQMARLIEIPQEEAYAVRDRAIMELLYSSALRVAELIRLNRRDIDFSDRVVRVLGKGSAARIVPVGSFAIQALKRWQRIRVARDGEQAVFVGRSGRRLTSRAIQLRLEYWGKRQGIATHVHPHMFRHACATHVLESSGSIREVQELLGHASISTTQIYTHLNAQFLFEAYHKAHPRAHRKKDSHE
ncbi:MAG TPA: tyrosine recombinase XerC [Steroidobacteraceae bacterium]|nr:tyrosine recombinase XerC [Steroidobacteraceae bacterium]